METMLFESCNQEEEVLGISYVENHEERIECANKEGFEIKTPWYLQSIRTTTGVGNWRIGFIIAQN
jgi:hypothetical protein